MARVWAQRWRTDAGHIKYSVHQYRPDINAFGIMYNRESYVAANELHTQGRPYETAVSEDFYAIVRESKYGKLVDWKP
jgi:hypothetical protein